MILRVGDKVVHRGKETEVIRLEQTAEGDKYGVNVNSVDWEEPFVADLLNGHWAYPDQIMPIDNSCAVG